jgi:Lrp/AsnC family leucine-responsive transcriptional regulator
MDEIDRKILNILQDKARVPNVEVARQVGMAPSAVLERIRKLEKQGVIDGYEVRLNPQRFNRKLVAFVTVHTAAVKNSVDDAAAFLAAIPEVQELHYVSGSDAFLLKIRVADTHHLGRIVRDRISTQPFVKATRTDIALFTYKETARFTID